MPSRNQWLSNFSEWFHKVIFEIPIYDTRYPVKGTGIWMPYGFKIRREVLEIIREELIKTGHEEVLFPTLIPEYLLKKEGEHIRNFEGQVFWITYGGTTPLDVRLALRPTSETSIYPMFQLWIKGYSDLPVKIFQIVNVFRYETKATKPMIRVREITTFKEAHTAHATKKEAENQVREGVEIYSRIFEKLGIPFVVSIRPRWDKFPGAEYSVAFDTIMPDGKVLQIGTVHFLGQGFARAFDIKYMNAEGNYEYVWQTCYGISERVIAALLAIHGDDHGLVLPSIVAPIQVVVIPIVYKGREEDIIKVCKEVREALYDEGLRVIIDENREETPGSKYFKWELRGVPIRVEIGPRDLERNTVVLVRRDTLEKITIERKYIVEEVKKLLRTIDSNLRERGKSWLFEHIFRESEIEKAKDTLNSKGGIVEIPWCGKDSCGQEIETKMDGRILGVPYNMEEKPISSCVNCKVAAVNWVRVAKSY
ncbi:MAG: proline--tRNA ligase [Candidatus Methanomethyliaceae archaeon]|nr:proline--tRNA ligase [Candidatus Methanomethyliaceae archaeon]MCX8169981.1 proline--tRNA ligase [Candidatus Methanomethyliaceae archaeon]